MVRRYLNELKPTGAFGYQGIVALGGDVSAADIGDQTGWRPGNRMAQFLGMFPYHSPSVTGLNLKARL